MKYKYCPFCGSENSLSMKKVKRTKIKETKVVKGVFDVWFCDKCDESFFHTWVINKENK
jgi:YgiT-type zinc finger domain-containing protein